MNIQIKEIRHGLILSLLSLVCGIFWAGHLATQHETLHHAFSHELEIQNQQELSMDNMTLDHEHHASHQQHSHSGSYAEDAMQRLLRGHIHFMGVGLMACVLLLITAMTQLKPAIKRLLAWSIGLAAIAYPPAWIIMGFRTVSLGPEAAEASIFWLFAPAAGLMLVSLFSLLLVLLIEHFKLYQIPLFDKLFERPK